jgi:hypothetical protein
MGGLPIPIEIDGRNLLVEKISWADHEGYSYDVTLLDGDKEILLTVNESFDTFPDGRELRILLEPENLSAAYAHQGA